MRREDVPPGLRRVHWPTASDAARAAIRARALELYMARPRRGFICDIETGTHDVRIVTPWTFRTNVCFSVQVTQPGPVG